MHTKLDHMRIFKAVAETGSLSDAAKILNRTPSAISMSLKQFTEQLGNELFETDRKSTLTPLGHYVLERSRNALKDFDESMDMIQRYAKGNFGTVRIASVPSFSTQLLPSIVKQFTQRFPDVRLELREIDSDLINKAVRNGVVDFGIASRLGAAHKLKTNLILEEPFGLVCRSDHELAQKQKSITWKGLQSEAFISNDLCKLIQNPQLEQLSQNVKLHIHNTASLLSFVEQGFGVTLLPSSAVPNKPEFSFLPLNDKSVMRQLFIIQHKQHRLNPAARNFKQQIIKKMKSKG